MFKVRKKNEPTSWVRAQGLWELALTQHYSLENLILGGACIPRVRCLEVFDLFY